MRTKAAACCLVDDGSRDATWELISKFSRENELVGGIKLAHNRGHQNALLAGLMTATQIRGLRHQP